MYYRQGKLADFNACATQNKIDDKKLLGCSNSDEGKNICRYNIAKESPGDRTMMPKCIFRPLNEIHAGDSYEFLDYYMSSACVTDFHSAVCAVFKTIKEPSLPPECNKKMLMGIFYQATNEASQKWFQSMAKIYDKLANVLVLKFQPCMLAELVSPGKLDCKDPNDPDCIAEKTHACVISLAEDRKVVFEFLKCSMQDTKKLPNFEKCATDNKIPYDKIKSCVDGDLGVKLCYNFGKARPETDSFPAFTYEWDYFPNVSADTATTNDLKYIICYQLKRYSIELRDECQ